MNVLELRDLTNLLVDLLGCTRAAAFRIIEAALREGYLAGSHS